MKISPVAHPTQIQQPVPSVNQEARQKAISMIMSAPTPAEPVQAPPQEYAVANPNNISPEEVSAVKATQSQQLDTQPITEATPLPKAVESKPEPKDDTLTRQFQELAKQERLARQERIKIQRQAQELKAKEDAIKSHEQELNDRLKLYEQGYISKDRLKQDPLGVLAEAELSYDELTQRLLNQPARDPRVDAELQSLKNEIKQLRQLNDEVKTQAKQQQDDSYKAAIKQIDSDVMSLVKSNPAEFETIAKTRSERDVRELIERTWQKDGTLLTVEEAAQEVENYLVEELYNTSSRIDKIKKRLEKSSAPTEPVQKTQAKQEQPQQMKTLTNTVSGTRKLSAVERAIARAQGFKGDF